jgi:hypothetical protein
MDWNLLRNILIITAVVIGTLLSIFFVQYKPQDPRVLAEYITTPDNTELIIILSDADYNSMLSYIRTTYPEYVITEELKINDRQYAFRLLKKGGEGK